MMKFPNCSVSAKSYSAGMCARNTRRVDAIESDSQNAASDHRPADFSAFSPASIRRCFSARSRSFSSWSISFWSSEHFCSDVTITADRSCMTKNAPRTTTSAYQSKTGHPSPSMSK